MTKQLNLFEDILPLDKGPSKKEIEKKVATMGDPKSDGAWARHMAANKRTEELRSLIRHGVEHGQTPVSTAPAGSKKQKSDVLNYINKMVDIYDGKEENFYPQRATPTQVGEVSKRLEESRQMTGEPNNWDLMRMTAKTPDERNEIKRILNKEYYKRGPKDMDPEDLKFIGKHKSQIVYPEIKVPHVEKDLKPTPPPEPRIPIEHTIKVLADKRLDQEQKKWDRENGRGGITDLLRPL